MAFTDVFIKRPVFAISMNLILLIAGIWALTSLNVRQYPKSDVAEVIITTAYIGASADLVRGFISTPLERAIAAADGIDYLDSKSTQGLSTITARLRLNFNTNDALTQIQAKVAQVRNDLPPEAEAPVIVVENADSRFAAAYLSFASSEMAQNEITDVLLRVVQPKLSSLPGVQKADILGGRIFAMRVWLKPERLAALNLSANEVADALRANNNLSAVGTAKGNSIVVPLITNTDLRSKEEFEQLAIRSEGADIVRLKDVADIQLGAETYDEEVRFGGKTAVFMGVWVLPNANSIDVIKTVRIAIDDLKSSLPTQITPAVAYDATAYINDALHEVISTLTETIFIVIVVIFLFIGSLRSTIIPVVAIPLSLIGAMLCMMMFGFTINLLTLLAIVLAVGLVVDDAIVMLENIERLVAQGRTPYDAAIESGRQLAGPLFAMSITLAAVYAPIGIQGGLTGTLFREFAFTLVGAVMMSGFTALTLSPVMGRFLVKANKNPSALEKRIHSTFAAVSRFYGRVLSFVVAYRIGIAAMAGIFILLLPVLYMFSAKELAPREDQGVIFSIVQAAPYASIEQTTSFTAAVQTAFESFPEYKTSFQLTNPTGGFAGALLKPWSERSRRADQIEPELWGKVSHIPGIRTIITSPPPLPGGSDFPVEFIISSTADPLEVAGYAQQLAGFANTSGMFMFADTDLKFDQPQAEIVLDRDKIATLGLTLDQVGKDLSAYLSGNYTNRFSIQGRSYKVIPQAKRGSRLTADDLKTLYVRGPNNSLLPLSSIARLDDAVQARSLNRFQQLNSAKIQGAQIPNISLDAALKALEGKAKEILPKSYSIDYAGEARQLRTEGGSFTTTLILASVLIFLVLAAQFESFRSPLIILAGSVPATLAGALSFIFLDFTTLNIYSQVGLVTLVGLTAKNGILIVEFANELMHAGKNKFEAITEAGLTRLRPVLMTSVATVVGHFPLILANGAGAGARNSIGIVLVSGMIIGTLFTLIVLPAIYLVLSPMNNKSAPVI